MSESVAKLFNARKFKEALDADTGGSSFAATYNTALLKLEESNDLDTFQETLHAIKKPDNAPESNATNPTGQWKCIRYDGHDIVIYNEGVLLYRQMAYESALELVQTLFQFREHLKSSVVIRVALLMLGCRVALRRISDAATNDLTTYLRGQESEMITIDSTEGTQLHRNYQSMLPMIVFYNGNVDGALAELRVWYEKHKPNDPGIDASYYNNLAVMTSSLGSLGTAGFFFNQAQGANNAQSTTIGMAFANHGTVLLQSGQNELALRCFETAASLIPKVPLVWIRMAQCCCNLYDAAYREAQAKSINNLSVRGEAALHRTVVVNVSANFTPTAKERQLLETAEVALRQALEITAHTTNIVLQPTIYCYLTYIALCQRNYNLALQFYATFEAGTGKLDKNLALIMASYNVEALCMSGQSHVALRFLSTVQLSDYIDTHPKEDLVAVDAEALFVNLIIASIVAGHYGKAADILTNVLAKNTTKRNYVLLQVYLELAQGNRDKAIEVIRKHTALPPVR
eukprot:PhF_6_TR34961/c0_g1_i1/m.50742